MGSKLVIEEHIYGDLNKELLKRQFCILHIPLFLNIWSDFDNFILKQ